MSFSKAIGTVMSSAPSSESSISYSRLSQAAPSEKGTDDLRTMGIGLIPGLEVYTVEQDIGCLVEGGFLWVGWRTQVWMAYGEDH